MVILIFAATLLNSGCGGSDNQHSQQVSPDRIGSTEQSRMLHHVSLAQLIVNPDLYDSKRVMVGGYIHLEFEGNGLYLHRDDFRYQMHANGVWIELASNVVVESCQDAYVIVRGTFSARWHGHMGLWSGAIKDVDSCERSEERVPQIQPRDVRERTYMTAPLARFQMNTG